MNTLQERIKLLEKLHTKVEPVPSDWFSNKPKLNGHSHTMTTIEPQRCNNWLELEGRWGEAQEWRQMLSDVTIVSLAVCASTKLGGNQLFFNMIGDPGCGKTTICKGLITSESCHQLDHIKSFYSGWKMPGDGDKDCSFLARISGKTLITCEADVMISSPNWPEIMGQLRRIYDGDAGKTFANTDEDRKYEGLRTPWIMAGTKKLLSVDQAQLGDRFMRVMIDTPDDALKDRILDSAIDSEIDAMGEVSNGTSASIVEPKLRRAQAMTGGYVDWLRANVEEKINTIDIDTVAKEKVKNLAKLAADLRARPDMTWKRPVDQHDSKELPTRLARQLVKLAKCVAFVMNKHEVDGDVMRIVRKVALDTAYGHTLSFVQYMTNYNPKKHGCTYQETGGLGPGILSLWTGLSEERLETYLNFLRKIGVAVLKKPPQSQGFWSLTERVYNLYLKVMED